MAIFGRRKSALTVPSQREPTGGRGRGVDLGAIGSVVAAAIEGTVPVEAACHRAAPVLRVEYGAPSPLGLLGKG